MLAFDPNTEPWTLEPPLGVIQPLRGTAKLNKARGETVFSWSELDFSSIHNVNLGKREPNIQTGVINHPAQTGPDLERFVRGSPTTRGGLYFGLRQVHKELPEPRRVDTIPPADKRAMKTLLADVKKHSSRNKDRAVLGLNGFKIRSQSKQANTALSG